MVDAVDDGEGAVGETEHRVGGSSARPAYLTPLGPFQALAALPIVGIGRIILTPLFSLCATWILHSTYIDYQISSARYDCCDPPTLR